MSEAPQNVQKIAALVLPDDGKWHSEDALIAAVTRIPALKIMENDPAKARAHIFTLVEFGMAERRGGQPYSGNGGEYRRIPGHGVGLSDDAGKIHEQRVGIYDNTGDLVEIAQRNYEQYLAERNAETKAQRRARLRAELADLELHPDD